MSPTQNLHALLAPIKPQQFVEAYFGQRVLVGECSDEARFSGILRLRDYYDIIRGLAANSSDVRHLPSLAHRINLAGADGCINMDGVLSGYAQGSTVHLDRADRHHVPLQRLVHTLGSDLRDLGYPLKQCGPATVFLTPPNSRALGPHTDPVDLFILQLEGEKHWRFYGDGPCTGPAGAKTQQLPPCSRQVVMRPGSFMYCPMGTIHEAHTTDTHSFAVSIGFAPFAWKDLLLQSMAAHAQESIELTRWLSPRDVHGERLTPAGIDTLRSWLRQLSEDETFLTGLSRLRLAAEPKNTGSFEEIHRLHAMTETTRIQPRGRLHYGVSAGRAVLFCDGREISGPAESMAATFESLSKRAGVFAVADISSHADADTKVALAKRLIFEGLHQFADEPVQGGAR